MTLSTVNLIMDFVLVAAAVWMVIVVRGIGGIVGRSLTLIVGGAIVLGIAHLVATFAGPAQLAIFDESTNSFVHRLIVLLGFVLLVFGFRQIRAIKE
jgi:hypothetical protein